MRLLVLQVPLSLVGITVTLEARMGCMRGCIAVHRGAWRRGGGAAPASNACVVCALFFVRRVTPNVDDPSHDIVCLGVTRCVRHAVAAAAARV